MFLKMSGGEQKSPKNSRRSPGLFSPFTTIRPLMSEPHRWKQSVIERGYYYLISGLPAARSHQMRNGL
jgi:hypothetical protein